MIRSLRSKFHRKYLEKSSKIRIQPKNNRSGMRLMPQLAPPLLLVFLKCRFFWCKRCRRCVAFKDVRTARGGDGDQMAVNNIQPCMQEIINLASMDDWLGLTLQHIRLQFQLAARYTNTSHARTCPNLAQHADLIWHCRRQSVCLGSQGIDEPDAQPHVRLNCSDAAQSRYPMAWYLPQINRTPNSGGKTHTGMVAMYRWSSSTPAVRSGLEFRECTKFTGISHETERFLLNL